MNDPNGTVYHNGVFHLYHQHNPYGMAWGDMHWGHAVSSDLMHWEHRGLAILPERDGLGVAASGSAVVDFGNTSGLRQGEHDVIVALFSRISPSNRQVQSLTYSNDGGETWTMYPHNPVIDNPGIADFRDPKVFWHPESARWAMVLAAGDHVQLHTSNDLIHWTHRHDFGHRHSAHGGVWECPDLFPLPVIDSRERKWVLLVSVQDGAPNGGSGIRYFLGDFDGETFSCDETAHAKPKWVDYGPDHYAGTTWSNAPGENEPRVMIGWMSNWKYAERTPTTTWRGAMALPRVLSLRTDAQANIHLCNRPVAATKRLREKRMELPPLRISPSEGGGGLIDMRRQLLELELEFEWDDDGVDELGFVFFNAQGETLSVGGHPGAGTLVADRSHAMGGGPAGLGVEPISAPMRCPDRCLRIHAFLDQSSLEVFANRYATTMTMQVFPRAPLLGMRLYSRGGSVNLRGGRAYLLKPVW